MEGGVGLRATGGNLAAQLKTHRHCDSDKPLPAALIEGNSVTFCVWSSREGRSDKLKGQIKADCSFTALLCPLPSRAEPFHHRAFPRKETSLNCTSSRAWGGKNCIKATISPATME